MRSTSIKLPDGLDRQLTAVACKRGVSRSKIVREALEAALAKTSAAPKASELAADLMFEGPGDLLTNPKYMTGFGR
ncbi:MAG: CopG family transcriptional regulator [Polyangiaceae bacterium]|jgi:predicted transcriptional regulator